MYDNVYHFELNLQDVAYILKYTSILKRKIWFLMLKIHFYEEA